MVPQSSSGWGPTQPRCSCCNCNHGSWRGRLALYYGKHPALTSQGSDVFPFPSPSTSHAQMLCSSLFYSSQHRFLSCCCVMPIMLQRQWLPWDFLFVWFIFFFLPWVLWWLLPLKCFKFFRSLYMKRNKGHVLTLCVHPCSATTYSLNEKENLKKMKSQQDSESDSFTLEWELKW